jgi:hypothetical protein
MSEMIERVARALDECHDPSSWHPYDFWDHDFALELARAAIEAMREPTDAMKQAGDDFSGNLAITHDASGEGTWQAMIDAALK